MKLRSYITATPGNILIQADLSQAESWVVAFCANEPNMKWSLQNSDIHVNTAEFYDDIPIGSTNVKDWKTDAVKLLKRYTAKRSNHAFAYRMSGIRFAQIFNKDAVENKLPEISNARANWLRNKWLERYDLKRWWAELEQLLSATRTLITPYGRTRMFFGSWGNELFKEATAYIPQSTVADHFNGCVQDELGIEGGLLTLWNVWRGTLSKHRDMILFVNQSHDSCIVDIHPSLKDDYIESAIKYLRRPLVINGEQFTIPVSIEVGERWGELEEIKI